ncbi:unnamed protein product [Urochloa decumbens]|uniref:Disease resistance N-terminal domain-containing protein n=1 Tax=Urochloa decumbens TaxID=240449 RepID=A0ABC9CYZ7_9POAL
MELFVSAIAGDIINRSISFLINKYSTEEDLREKTERLQDLLLRVHMIIEEAEGRYITNSKMLLQLRMLVEVMYQGYHVLDTVKYRTLRRSRTAKEVSSFKGLSFTTFINQRHTTSRISISHVLQTALNNLESVVSNTKEFALLLGGCERMHCSRPYDSYLYIDNFMFSRHMEKQQVINFLLEDNIPPLAPGVLPIIGGIRVGKKTLIAHACNNEKVRRHFTWILHLKGERILRREKEPFIPERTLVVIEFTSDVDDDNWLEFYSSGKQMARGTKIVIVSRIEKLSRFGTVKPVYLKILSQGEYSYLFKVLAFGSTNPEEHPKLATIAHNLAAELGGSFISANMCADMLRKNQNIHFWRSIYEKYRNVVHKNFSRFGGHPKNLMDKDCPIDATSLASSSLGTILRIMPPHDEMDDPKRELPRVTFGDLVTGSAALPKEFEFVAWESRIPPYKRFVNHGTTAHCDEEIFQHQTGSPCKKRQRLDK